jgi:predicted dehydrogenase
MFGGFAYFPALEALVYNPSGKPSEDGFMRDRICGPSGARIYEAAIFYKYFAATRACERSHSWVFAAKPSNGKTVPTRKKMNRHFPERPCWTHITSPQIILVMPNQTIRIGIIGAGFARTTQIPGFKDCEGARVMAIASAHRQSAEEAAREFDIPHVESDWRALVAREDVDLVSVVTPVATHCEITLAALDHRKAVLCEKPMAMNASEARRMADRARDAGVLALIDHELRFLPGRQQLYQLLRDDAIGKVKHLKLTFRSDSRADVARPWNWWSDVKQGGGTLGAIGSHVIDGFRWLLGTEVSKIFGNLATHVHERPDAGGQLHTVTTDDEANLLLRFSESDLTEGATGNVSLSMVEPGKPEHLLEIFGADGAFRIEDRGELWQSKTGAGEWTRIEVEDSELAPGLRDSGWARGFTIFSKQIVETMRAGQTAVPGAATFEDGYRTQLVLDAARESFESGCWAKVN